jgi:hypothetical protein
VDGGIDNFLFLQVFPGDDAFKPKKISVPHVQHGNEEDGQKNIPCDPIFSKPRIPEEER